MGYRPAADNHRAAPDSYEGVKVRGGLVHVPSRLLADGSEPALVDFRGREVPLRPMGGGVWRIGAETRPGIHILLVGGRSVHRFLL